MNTYKQLIFIVKISKINEIICFYLIYSMNEINLYKNINRNLYF